MSIMVRALAGVAVALALVACAGPSVTKSTAVAAPTSASLPEEPAAIGQTLTLTEGDDWIKATVYGTKTVKPGQYSILNAGEVYTAVDIEVCLSAASTLQSSDRWSLSDAKNGRYEPDFLTSEAVQPEYPYLPAPVAAGECIRGWVMFVTLDDTPATTVRYTLGTVATMRWAI